jgi:DNA-binding transcriptional regulator YiaG
VQESRDAIFALSAQTSRHETDEWRERVFVAPRKLAEYEEARRLRRAEGTPLKRIAARLGVSVSTVHVWTRDIELTPEQEARNLTGPRGPRSPEAIAKFVRTWSGLNRERRRSYQQEGRRRARVGEALHEAGCMLYWAEGAKERNSVRFCNSDIQMVRFFKRFLSECFCVPGERFRLSLHVYLGNGLTLRQVEARWLRALDLSATCARKHFVNPLPTSSSGSKRAKLLYGVGTLCVYDTRIVQHIYGAIQEYGGFEEPRWLDGPPRPRSR